jgi:hypothetical protein
MGRFRALWIGVRTVGRSVGATPPSANWQDLREWYFDAGVQYYVSARMAFFERANPVAGNLFHLAIEMVLKGYLCETTSRQTLKRIGHNLKRLWKRFKGLVKDRSLDRFDETIRAVNHFQELRYPDRLRAYSIQFALRGPFGPPMGRSVPPPNRRFNLAVNDVDDLVAVVFQKASRNPQAYAMRLSPRAKDYLTRDNLPGVW